jgi:hypothetical protein
MKGKINSQGFLQIYRGDANPKHYQPQICPFRSNAIANQMFEQKYTAFCGQWCPHFGEPFNLDYYTPEGEKRVDEKITLDLCHGKTLIFEELEVE